jgi:hypothetical protein
MQPKYKSRKEIDADSLVTKWKLGAQKKKIILGQSNPENLLTEEITSYKIVALTTPLQ